jgi:hypothetical protein
MWQSLGFAAQFCIGLGLKDEDNSIKYNKLRLGLKVRLTESQTRYIKSDSKSQNVQSGHKLDLSNKVRLSDRKLKEQKIVLGAKVRPD